MKGANSAAARRAAGVEALLSAFGALLLLFSAVSNGPGFLQDLSIGGVILFSAISCYFAICYYRKQDPYRSLGGRAPPLRLP